MQTASTEKRQSTQREWALFALFMGAIFTGVFIFAAWSVQRAEDFVSTQNVGQIISAEFLQGLAEDKTSVATTLGTFLVYGTFQAFKGNPVSLEVRKNSDKYLCDTTTKTCKKLAA